MARSATGDTSGELASLRDEVSGPRAEVARLADLLASRMLMPLVAPTNSAPAPTPSVRTALNS